MSGLTNPLQELRTERSKAQAQVEKLDRAISVMKLLKGSEPSSVRKSSGRSHPATRPVRVISAASRRKMAKAQKARWAKVRNGAQPAKEATKKVASTPAKRTLSAAARKKIAAFQRARWAKLKAGKTAA
jgi:phosphopantothenoylcysteine synthetase/decarboxylase